MANLIYDSGSTIEDLLADMPDLQYFYDKRSDDKGRSQRTWLVGYVGGRPYLFVGLERANGVMAFDVSEPESRASHGFIAPDSAFTIGAEGEVRISGATGLRAGRAQPDRAGLLLVTNEVSGIHQSLRAVQRPQ